VQPFDPIFRYHDGTKHAFNRFARSPGYLDWASQPAPFRSFAGAPAHELPFGPSADARRVSPALVGDILRHSLGLSAWKSFKGSRWALRVNPSSGNLHPTEAYVVTGAAGELSADAAVWHYAPDRHALERRCRLAAASLPLGASCFLIALTSIHWREAWKYGERAFRYCQHDLGHAIAALRIAADFVGWYARLLPSWSHAHIAALAGLDRDADYPHAEREEPASVLLLAPAPDRAVPDAATLVDAVRAGEWTGQANRLSENHVEWSFIDEIARSTVDPGRTAAAIPDDHAAGRDRGHRPAWSRSLVLQRRSALGFDAVSRTSADTFTRMLARTLPDDGAPWDALWWDARIHLALFVHRVEGLDPGLYVLPREPSVLERLQTAMRAEFLWERSSDAVPLYLLARGDARSLARRLSCDQDIAADGFFSLGMIADFERSLAGFGPSFYRHLFWESGVVGQVLYLEAEAAGVRGTGIGCFYDDPVHEVLGLEGHAFQSLYHFTIGVPVEDPRLTTEPGYGHPRR
jgi:SagB-type dehydrogenase family enzyme